MVRRARAGDKSSSIHERNAVASNDATRATTRSLGLSLYPALIIGVLCVLTGLFRIDDGVINRGCLFSFDGNSRAEFLAILNLPRELGAVLVTRSAGKLIRSEEAIWSYSTNDGELLVHQLLSLLLHLEITEHTIALVLNGIFAVFAVAFSLTCGYLILGDGWLSIPIFLLLALFKHLDPGMIYGMTDTHSYAVFNPLIMFSLLAVLPTFLRARGKLAGAAVAAAGFLIGWSGQIRLSELQMEVATLAVVLSALAFIDRQRRRNALLAAALLGCGFAGYRATVRMLRFQRDHKIAFEGGHGNQRAYVSFLHPLFISLFRFDSPNQFGDDLGYRAFYLAHPELADDFKYHPTFPGSNLMRLTFSKEYADFIGPYYFHYVAEHPSLVAAYLARSLWDYFLFLPCFSWSGAYSSQGYIPSLTDQVPIEPDDLAPYFPFVHRPWLLNLRWRYLPSNPLFFLYFALSYLLLAQAIWFAIGNRPQPPPHGAASAADARLLIQGMLVYFAFCSAVRILIPLHGHSAAVAFNTIVVFNLVRLGSERAASFWLKHACWVIPATAAVFVLHRSAVAAEIRSLADSAETRRLDQASSQHRASAVAKIDAMLTAIKTGAKDRDLLGFQPRAKLATFSLSEEEINDYARNWILTKHGVNRIAVRSAVVHLGAEGRIELNAVAGSERIPINNKVELRCRLLARDGKASLQIEGARLKGLAVPAWLLRRILAAVGRSQRPPLDFGRPFDLPGGIESIEVMPRSLKLGVRLPVRRK